MFHNGPAHRNKTLSMAPMDTPGISRDKPIRKIGMHASDTGRQPARLLQASHPRRPDT
jgi:hypothetical protein